MSAHPHNLARQMRRREVAPHGAILALYGAIMFLAFLGAMAVHAQTDASCIVSAAGAWENFAHTLGDPA